MNARLNAAQALSGDIGAGSVVVNDYQIQADAIDGGHRLTITRGSEVQTMDLMDGAPGAQGDTGPAGPQGEQGPQGEPGKDAPQEAVLYTPQTLTTEQQAQARENIAAAGVARLEAVDTALAGKLDEPAEGLAVGKYFRVAALDENGHAVLEAVDAKTVGVQDVQLAGESVVADGVANVPIANDNNLGLVKIYKSGYYGLNFSSDGYLELNSASDSQITNRADGRMALRPANIDLIVKAAMCDGKGAAWTAEEQAAARERIGVNKPYELIEKITLDEKVSVVERSFEPDGNEYNFRDLTVVVYTPVASDNATYDCYITDSNNVKLPGVISGMLSGSIERNSIFYFERHGEYINIKTCAANLRHQLTIGNLTSSPSTFGIMSGEIKKMELIIRSDYTAQLPIGTEINIYGVRA